ncbi:hypothetical protein AB4564_18515 [Vibrio sp. 10N.222.51.E8]|uniref:GntT/GntP/DsdX family permease n=1 Tax=unclassified Vibrio TaxID=2614977 RepID=UPI0010BD9014|nr:hypothetical protein [Vibrio sp. F13]TKG34114.1 hypothetical protein FCV85_07195 [Vibrio sp. F13]
MDGALIGIVIGILAMMGMIIKTRIPVALAMVIASIIMGLFAGMAPTELIDAIKAGFGGAMGAVLKASGAGPQVAEAIASSGIPPLLVPLAIASMLRLIQGSATASMMVAATMTLPLVETLGLDPVFVALACAVGPVGFSHLNDSYFHIINRTLGITELADQIKIWSVSSTIAWAIGASIIMILNLVFGKGGTLIDPLIPIAVLGAVFVWLKSKEKSQVKTAVTN